MREVEEADAGVKLSSGGRLGGLLFADDFVGVGESKDQLQRLTDVVCLLLQMEANVSTSAVMVFARESDIDGAWKWGECTCFLHLHLGLQRTTWSSNAVPGAPTHYQGDASFT